MRDATLGGFLEALSSGEHTPGGGAAAALAGALATGLLGMASAVGLKRKPDDPALREINARAKDLLGKFLDLAREDAEAYRGVSEALKLPKSTPEEKEERKRRVQEALVKAAEVPLRTAELSAELLGLIAEALPVCPDSVASDLLSGARLAHAAALGALYNVDANCLYIESPEVLSRFKRQRLKLEKAVSARIEGFKEAEAKIKKWLGEEDSNLH